MVILTKCAPDDHTRRQKKKKTRTPKDTCANYGQKYYGPIRPEHRATSSYLPWNNKRKRGALPRVTQYQDNRTNVVVAIIMGIEGQLSRPRTATDICEISFNKRGLSYCIYLR